MNPKTAYEFLKPSLDQFSQEEKDELCRLISGKPEEKKQPKNKKMDQDLKDIAYLKRRLLKSGHFKN